MRLYDYTAWKDEGIWTAHSPSVPGAYGLGKTKDAAARDLGEAIQTLTEYLVEVGEKAPKRVEVSIGRVQVRQAG